MKDTIFCWIKRKETPPKVLMRLLTVSIIVFSFTLPTVSAQGASGWLVLNMGDNPEGNTWQYDDLNEEVFCLFGAYDEYQDEWLITPAIDLTSSMNPFLSFTHDMEYWAFDTDPNEVLVSTTGTNPSDFLHPVYSITYPDPDPDYSEVIIDLSVFSGETIYIAWVYRSIWGENWYLDNIVVADIPTVLLQENFDEDPFEPEPPPGAVPLFSDALWILPGAILASVLVVLRRRRKHLPTT